MPHQSSLDKMKLQMKKLRKQRTKKKLAENEKLMELGEKEYELQRAKKYDKTTSQQVAIALWDYSHGQYPMSKFPFLRELLEERLKENPRPDEEEQIKRVLNAIRIR